MKQLRGFYAQTFFTFRKILDIIWGSPWTKLFVTWALKFKIFLNKRLRYRTSGTGDALSMDHREEFYVLNVLWRVYILKVRFASLWNFSNLKKENVSPINEYSISKFSALIFLSMFLLNFSAVWIVSFRVGWERSIC